MPGPQGPPDQAFAHVSVLKDDGVTYHQCVSERTYLLLLKMAQETGREQGIPEAWRWSAASETDKLDGSQGL